MKQITVCFLLSFILVISACTKISPSPTQGSLTAQKLVTILGSSSGTLTNGRVIYARDNAGYLIYTATTYSISNDGFITLSGLSQITYTYNLTFLKYYTVYDVGAGNVDLNFSF